MSDATSTAKKLISPMNLITLFLGVASVSLGILSVLEKRQDEGEIAAAEDEFYGYQ